MKRFAFDSGACERLAAAHGTPCFVYSEAVALHQADALRAALPLRARLAYAVKANPHEALLASFAARGLDFDCASAGELQRLLRVGVEGRRIFFAGPGKRLEEIRAALAAGVRLQAEGIEDLERAEAVAADLGLETVTVNLRVHPLGIEERGSILGGSGPSAFGIDEEDLPGLLAEARRLRRVRIRGLHGFAASNELDASRLLANHRRLFEIGADLQERLGAPLEQIDLGGGLGAPYGAGETPLDVAALGRGLVKVLAGNPWFQGEIVLEPGRFLAAPCGVYLTRVTRVKESRGERFAILEGGINHLLRPLLTGEPFPVQAVGREGERRPTTLAGPLCTCLDRLGRVDLPPLAAGDLLVFGLAGAYGSTEAMTRFLDQPPAGEVWIRSAAARERPGG